MNNPTIKIFAFNCNAITGTCFGVPEEMEDELNGKQDDDLFTSEWVIEEVARRFNLPLLEIEPISFDLTIYREVS